MPRSRLCDDATTLLLLLLLTFAAVASACEATGIAT
jgi:hypothetical protein